MYNIFKNKLQMTKAKSFFFLIKFIIIILLQNKKKVNINTYIQSCLILIDVL